MLTSWFRNLVHRLAQSAKRRRVRGAGRPRFRPGIEELEKRWQPANHLVNVEWDGSDYDLNDGLCDADPIAEGEQCTLRAAIQNANHDAGRDEIRFSVATVRPTSAMTVITDDVLIDGWQGAARTEIDGSGAGPKADGLKVDAGAVEIRGLVINRHSHNGIVLGGAGGSVVTGCYLGTDVSGTADLGNKENGISLRSSNNTIGGIGADKRNLISGNDDEGVLIQQGNSGNVIFNCYIGTDVSGTLALGNAHIGVQVYGAPNNTIGKSEGMNVISANGFDGVVIQLAGATGNLVYNNYIGTDVTGTKALGNGWAANAPGDDDVGVRINDGASNNEVDNNVISGNIDGGVRIDDGAFSNKVTANRIGTDANGQQPLANLTYGVVIRGGAHGNELLDNVISANKTYGVHISEGAHDNKLRHNFVGTNIDGNKDLGNTLDGVFIEDAPDNTIGGTGSSDGNIISGNDASGVVISGGAATGNLVVGNRIGTDKDGVKDLGNTLRGVHIVNAPGNIIGGAGDGARNLISGNDQEGVRIALEGAAGNVVQGNYIGTDKAGTADLGNGSHGVFVVDAPANLIGGAAFGEGNLISGNDADGVRVSGPTAAGNVVQGNLIGTDAGGAADLGNTRDGVSIDNAPGNLIGAAGAGNVIAGNDASGVVIAGAQAVANLVQGNFIGTDIGGAVDLGNTLRGVHIVDAPGNIVGGAAAGEGNLISGNDQEGVRIALAGATGNVVQGNFIGTDVGGAADLGNSSHGVFVVDAPSNVIGGAAAGAGNLISGNDADGVRVSGPAAAGNVVQNNFIGTDVAGAADLGNTRDGVSIDNAPGTLVGGVAAGAGNLISGNDASGVVIAGAQAVGNLVQGNFIGTDVAGAADLGNTLRGVHIVDAPGNMVGGAAAGARNLISGNDQEGVRIALAGATGNVVQGNYIGTDAAGVADLGNSSHGVFVVDAPANVIGGAAAGEGNLISGNDADGVRMSGPAAAGNVVQGCLIGTDVTGANALGNSRDGVAIDNAPNNTVGGGVAPEEGNVISGNGGHGVHILGEQATNNEVLGNFIGTKDGGADALPNAKDGVFIDNAPGNRIGSLLPAARNVISGNGQHGVEIKGLAATKNSVAGNVIGADLAGSKALPNALNGVMIDNAPENMVGGTLDGERNLISGNGADGVFITGRDAKLNVLHNNSIGAGLVVKALGNAGNGVTIDNAPENSVGGLIPAAGNLIQANKGHGVEIRGADAKDNKLYQNTIGATSPDAPELGNAGNGVWLRAGASGNKVGAAIASAANTIAGNGAAGVAIAGNATMDNEIKGNTIGLNQVGNKSHGVYITADANGNKVGGLFDGEGNTIAFNGGDGVYVEAGVRNPIRRNGIHSNVGLGIDLDENGVTANDSNDPDHGGNERQNFPVLLSVVTKDGMTEIEGMLESAPDLDYRIELFSNTAPDPSGFGEGQHYLDFAPVHTSGTGIGFFKVSVPAARFISATATDKDGNTSEFSATAVVDLDVNGDMDITDPFDGAVNYLPGYEGNTRKVSTGSSFAAARYVGQKMKIVVEGIGRNSDITEVMFEIVEVTSHAGYAGNATDAQITGVNKEKDYSFKKLEDKDSITVTRATTAAQGGRMETDRTWADFWCKDYGGKAKVIVTLLKDGAVVLTQTLSIPLDEDSDGISDKWEKEKVTQWNTQFGVAEAVTNAFFAPADDKELRDPDAAGNTDGGTNMNQHQDAGDGRTLLQEYRGYIMDGGGLDWNGGNAHPGGHVRLAPAFKELLIEVDAMTGTAEMPSRAGIVSWLRAVSKGMSQKTDGAGIRMFFALDNLATPHSLFAATAAQTSDQLRTAYAAAHAHAEMTTFKHLLLVDSFADHAGADGLSTNAWSMYAVDTGKLAADFFWIPVATYATGVISHELHHTIVVQAGSDGGEHFNDANGNGTGAEADDQTRVLWNYNFAYPAKSLAVAVNAAANSIRLDNVTNLTRAGIVLIGAEEIRYTGISGTTLTGCTRGVHGTVAAVHAAGDAVTPQQSSEEMKRIRYGLGTTQHISIR